MPVALIVAIIFAFGFKGKRSPWNRLWAFFLLIFFTIWGLFVWLKPAGISTMNAAWVPSIFLGIVLTFMLAGALAERS